MFISSDTQTNTYSKNTKNAETNSSENQFAKELSSAQNSNTTDNEKVETQRSDRELVEDIISLMKTGFTKEELEAIEDLKEAILAKINDEEKSGTENGVNEIKNLLAELEKMIQALKKSVLGVVIEEADENNNMKSSEGTNKEIDNSLNTLNELKAKLSDLSSQMQDLEKLQKETRKPTNNQEELFLMQKLKNL